MSKFNTVTSMSADDLFRSLEDLPEYIDVSVSGGAYRDLVYCNRSIAYPGMICIQFDDASDKMVLGDNTIVKVRYNRESKKDNE